MTQLPGPIQLKGGTLAARPATAVDRQPYFAKNDGAAGTLYIYDAEATAWRKVGGTGAVTSVADRMGDVVLGESDITGLVVDLATLAAAITSEASTRSTADSLRELLTNKDTDGTLASNSDTKYASQKAIKTYVDAETTRATTAEATKQSTSAKDQASGYAGLDSSGLLKTAELPPQMDMFANMPNARFVPTFTEFSPANGPNYDMYTVPTGKRAMVLNFNVIPGAINGPITGGGFGVRPQVKIGGTYYRTAIAPANTVVPLALTFTSGSTYIAEAGEIVSFARTSQFTLSAAASAATTALTLTAVSVSSSGAAVYTGTITNGVTSAFAGYTFTITGFATSANNGTFLCIASSTTTLTLVNLSASAETHAGTATTQSFTIYTGASIDTTVRGSYVTVAGFANGVNNGRFLVLNSTSTTLTVANPSGTAETLAATASLGAYFSLSVNILEFDNTSPLRTVKILSTVQGGNVFYTPPGFKNGMFCSSLMAGNLFSSQSCITGYNDTAINSVWTVHLLKGVTETAVLTSASLAVGGLTAYVGNFQEASSTALALTATANASGSNTTYTGTITNGGANAYAGQWFLITGFGTAANNGLFLCTGSTATTLIMANSSGVASSTQVATAVASPLSGKSVTISGFSNAGNNGTFNCVFATSTLLIVSNSGGIAETHAGSMSTTRTANQSNRLQGLTSSFNGGTTNNILGGVTSSILNIANGDTISLWFVDNLSPILVWANVIEF